ncbi:MAG TPA: YlxR family protein [Candidatus Sulfomarinibacteraceae bacterium]|nr:YlxR family protein [Candidatus Sulfomarinibacteraceae bacterium]
MAKKSRQKQRKHIPQRTCIVCGQKDDKRQLVRLVRTPAKGIVVDHSGKRPGRGAYLCHQASCWEKALRGNDLERALKTTITEAERESLAEQRPATDVEDAV